MDLILGSVSHGPYMLDPHFSQSHQINHTARQEHWAFGTAEFVSRRRLRADESGIASCLFLFFAHVFVLFFVLIYSILCDWNHVLVLLWISVYGGGGGVGGICPNAISH